RLRGWTRSCHKVGRWGDFFGVSAPEWSNESREANGGLHEGTMAFIKTIPAREANDELRAIYGMMRSDMVGSLPFPVEWTTWNVMQVLSLRPQLVWGFERGFRHFMWDGELRRL